MKKCTQCGQTLSEETNFCFKCGGSSFDRVAEEGAEQQQTYQQPIYQQPYQAQPVCDNSEPATIGNFLIFNLLMLIPIFNIVYLIIVAVGGPSRKKSMVNYARASLIWIGIIIVLYIIIFAIVGASMFSIFSSNSYNF